MTTMSARSRRVAAGLAVTTAAVLGVSACSSPNGAGGTSHVNLVAFSVPKPAYTALEAAFEKTSAGKGASFSETYGPSGTESKAVAGGQKADYVHFSTGSDMTALVPGQVAASWDSGSTKGIVADSVVVIVVRKGNPLHITGWDDLTKSGIKIVTPDPSSSGSAKWNLLAAYEHVISEGGTPAQASAYVTKFFANVVSRADSGSDAATQFTAGTGNVLISYESEAIALRKSGADVDYVVPKESMLIQTPAAVTKDASPMAKKFLAYVESGAGQQIFAANGFRPAVAGTKIPNVEGANNPSNPFPSVPKLTTIDSLGGWSAVNDKFFDDTNGIITKIDTAG